MKRVHRRWRLPLANDSMIPLHDLFAEVPAGKDYIQGHVYTGGSKSAWPVVPEVYLIPGSTFDPHKAERINAGVTIDPPMAPTGIPGNPHACDDQGYRATYRVDLGDRPKTGMIVMVLEGTNSEDGKHEWSIVAATYPSSEGVEYDSVIPITVDRPWYGPTPPQHRHEAIYTHKDGSLTSPAFFYVPKPAPSDPVPDHYLGRNWIEMKNVGQGVSHISHRKQDFHFNKGKAQWVMVVHEGSTVTCESHTVELSGVIRPG